MTSQLNVDIIADKAGSGPVGLNKQEASKARVTFDGTASGATIGDSFNVSSSDDDGTGDYGINFSNITHCPICGGGDWKTQGILQGQEPTTSGTGQIQTRYPNTAGALDTERTGHMIAGDLA